MIRHLRIMPVATSAEAPISVKYSHHRSRPPVTGAGRLGGSVSQAAAPWSRSRSRSRPEGAAAVFAPGGDHVIDAGSGNWTDMTGQLLEVLRFYPLGHGGVCWLKSRIWSHMTFRWSQGTRFLMISLTMPNKCTELPLFTVSLCDGMLRLL